jgi:alanine dehydrogenase
VWRESEMIMKVKEPIKVEWPRMRKGQLLFTYFHFAADEELTRAHMASGATCVAYETVELPTRELPLLTPMSEVAGRMAVQEGAKYLEKLYGGRGVLLGGVPGVVPAKVVILGGGIVGINAAKMAAGMGAKVVILDISLERLRYLSDVMPANVQLIFSNRHNILEQISTADLVIGGVLIPGAKAPKLVRRADLSRMRPGSVIVDVAIDQGGCVETIHATTHENPTYVVDGVIHYGVANMPGGVPRTSTLALTNATLPYALQLANKGWKRALKENPALLKGLNIVDGKVTYAGVAEAFGMEFSEPAAFVA